MAYGDEKVIVDVKDVEHGEILYTDKEGKEHTYYPCRNIWLEVQTLEILTVLADPREDDKEPNLVTRVRGTVALEDRSISVVGDRASKVRKLDITFEAGEWRPKAEEPKEGDLPSLSSHLGGAMLGFNRADWEIGNDDEWWISCFLPKPFIDALVLDIRGGQLDSMRLCLQLRSLYTTEHSWAPVSSRGDLFIRPDRRDNSLAIPDMAEGYVNAVHFASAPRDLRKPETVEPIEPEDGEAPSAPASDPVATAIAALAARVEATRSTIKWVGGLIALALILAAGR